MDGATFQIGQPPARIDILQQIDGITFDEAWENRIEGLIDGQIQAAVMSRDDLIRNKVAPDENKTCWMLRSYTPPRKLIAGDCLATSGLPEN
jgi:hypothetical protein